MKKKIFLTILIFLIISALGVAFINFYLIPKKGIAFITHFLEEKLNRRVEIGTLNYIPPARLILGDVTIFTDRIGAHPLLTADKIGAGLSLIPFITKKDILSSLNVENLRLRELRFDGGIKTSLSPDKTSVLGYTGSVRLLDLTLDPGFIKTGIDKINGILAIESDSVRINDAYFYVNDLNYKLDGGLTNFDKPTIDFLVESNGFRSEGNFLLKRGYLEIKKINAKLGDSSIDVIGDISSFKDPVANIYVESRINLSDLGYFQEKKPEKKNFEGVCDTYIFFNGGLNRLREAELVFKARSKKITAYNYIFNDFDMDLRMKNGLLTTQKMTSNFYNGRMNAVINTDLLSDRLPYAFEFTLEDADLAKWAKEAKFNKKIAGIVSWSFLLKGQAKDIDTINGMGLLEIRDGYLWELPLLIGVADKLNVPGLRSIVFTEAKGDIYVESRKINISNLTFFSDELNVSMNGNIDFDKRLDILVVATIMQDLIGSSSDAAQIANFLIQKAGQFLGRVKITGTLDNPTYNMIATKEIKPIENIIKGGIGDFLKGVLE